MSIRKKRKLSTLRKNCHISQSDQLILVTFGVHFLYSLKARIFFNLSDICFRNFHWLHFKCRNKTGQLLNEIIVLKERIMRRTTNRTTKLQIYRSFLFAPSLLPEILRHANYIWRGNIASILFHFEQILSGRQNDGNYEV